MNSDQYAPGPQHTCEDLRANEVVSKLAVQGLDLEGSARRFWWGFGCGELSDSSIHQKPLLGAARCEGLRGRTIVTCQRFLGEDSSSLSCVCLGLINQKEL